MSAALRPRFTAATSRRRSLVAAVGGALLAVCVTLPAHGDAPIDQYERFDRDALTVVDHYTALEWERRVPLTPASFAVATSRCGVFFAGGRLPTVKELLTIFDEQAHQEFESGAVVSKHIDRLAFPNTPVSALQWTSSPAPGGKIWTVDFATGQMQAVSTSSSLYGRCVR